MITTMRMIDTTRPIFDMKLLLDREVKRRPYGAVCKITNTERVICISPVRSNKT